VYLISASRNKKIFAMLLYIEMFAIFGRKNKTHKIRINRNQTLMQITRMNSEFKTSLTWIN